MEEKANSVEEKVEKHKKTKWNNPAKYASGNQLDGGYQKQITSLKFVKSLSFM